MQTWTSARAEATSAISERIINFQFPGEKQSTRIEKQKVNLGTPKPAYVEYPAVSEQSLWRDGRGRAKMQ